MGRVRRRLCSISKYDTFYINSINKPNILPGLAAATGCGAGEHTDMNTRFAPGLHPFWFWNTPLDEATIEAQVAELARVGCRGVFISPRQGMTVPYLSEAFFVQIRQAVMACVRHGITPHIYDEFPYPSGMAGGLVCMGHPEFLATKLEHHHREHDGGAVQWRLPAGDLLSCVAVPLRGDEPQWENTVDLREAAGSVYTKETWFNGGLTPYTSDRYFAHDPMLEIETDLPAGRWLLTASLQSHRREHKYWGDYVDVCDPEAMRRFIALTHEAYARHLGPELMRHIGCCFVDEIHPDWSRHFATWYRERHGEDIATAMPALAHATHPHHHRMRQRIDDLRYEAFVTAFEKPLAEWCRAHDVLYVVEKPQLRLEQLRFADIPGSDSGHRRTGDGSDLLRAPLRSNARVSASAAQIYGKQGATCEVFHSLGWSATLEDARRIVDLLLLHGVDRIVPHAAFASTHGLRKNDAPPSWFTQRPDWELFHHIPARIDRICAALGPLHHDADLLVIEPLAVRGSPEVAVYEALLLELTASCREFLIVDRSWVLAQDAGEGGIVWRERSITDLIAPTDHRDPELEAWLERFTAAGGAVTRGTMPASTAALGLTVEAGEPGHLQQARFLVQDRPLLFAVNHGDGPVTVRIPAGYTTHDLGDAPLPIHDQRLDLPASAGVLLVPGPLAVPVPQMHVAWPHRWRFQAEAANLLRLGEWDLSVTQDGAARGTARVLPRPIGDQLAAGKIPVSYQRHPRFGLTATLALPTLTLTCQRRIQVGANAGPLTLVIEPDSLRAVTWHVDMDGRRFTSDAFVPVPHHVAGSLGVPIGILAPGEHTISVHLLVDRDDHGLVAPLYLGGTCAVSVVDDTPIIDALPQEAALGDVIGAGLAHYAGRIEWESWLDLTVPDGEQVDLDLPHLDGDSYEIAFNDGPWHPVIWAPRRLRLHRSELRTGRNRCRIRQSTTLGRSFDAS